jgi:hypothetical protein
LGPARSALRMLLAFCLCATCVCPVFGSVSDDFEDGIIDSSKWVTHGYHGGYDPSSPQGWSVGAGQWQSAVTEVQAADGYLQARVWGPASGATYGAEAWVRTVQNFNDGNRWLINFTWSTRITDANGVAFALLMSDGNYSENCNWAYWIAADPQPGSAFLWRQQPSGPPWPGDPPTAPFSLASWSVVVDPSGSATLYQAANAQGAAFRQVSLDPSSPWYMRFVVNSMTSSGYSARDDDFKLYSFSADATAVPEPATYLAGASALLALLFSLARGTRQLRQGGSGVGN